MRVSDGELLWGSEFDEKFTDMFAVEDSISEKVASALVDNLSGAEQERLARPFTANNECSVNDNSGPLSGRRLSG